MSIKKAGIQKSIKTKNGVKLLQLLSIKSSFFSLYDSESFNLTNSVWMMTWFTIKLKQMVVDPSLQNFLFMIFAFGTMLRPVLVLLNYGRCHWSSVTDVGRQSENRKRHSKRGLWPVIQWIVDVKKLKMKMQILFGKTSIKDIDTLIKIILKKLIIHEFMYHELISGKRSKFVTIICSQVFYLRRGFKPIQICL